MNTIDVRGRKKYESNIQQTTTSKLTADGASGIERHIRRQYRASSRYHRVETWCTIVKYYLSSQHWLRVHAYDSLRQQDNCSGSKSSLFACGSEDEDLSGCLWNQDRYLPTRVSSRPFSQADKTKTMMLTKAAIISSRLCFASTLSSHHHLIIMSAAASSSSSSAADCRVIPIDVVSDTWVNNIHTLSYHIIPLCILPLLSYLTSLLLQSLTLVLHW